MKMKTTKSLIMLLSIALLSLFVLSACEEAKDALDSASEKVSDVAKKVGDTAKDVADKSKDAAEGVVDATKEGVDKAGEIAKDAIVEVSGILGENGMVGVWSGKLDSRATTLVITKQDGNNFEGRITINYRTPINQEVKGTVDAKTRTIKMADQLHSRYKGKYSGKLSDDEKSYIGTFTKNVDKTSFRFKLTKK